MHLSLAIAHALRTNMPPLPSDVPHLLLPLPCFVQLFPLQPPVAYILLTFTTHTLPMRPTSADLAPATQLLWLSFQAPSRLADNGLRQAKF